MNPITIKNPIIWADIPDMSIIRVGSVYYMSSTSMHSMPGCPIMKSNNLRDWEIIGYVFDQLESNDAHHLRNGQHIYGQGAWASSLRYHNGKFYLCFSANDTNQFYLFITDDIESGNWEKHIFDGLHHDPSLLFDENRVFIIYGNGKIFIKELTADAAAVKVDGVNQVLLETEKEGMGLRAEGCHAYKMNNYYYLFFIEWPKTGNRRRRQVCYRSKELFGPYESKVVLDDDLGFFNHGVAQGGIVDTMNGEWYALLFQDHGAVGRVPILVPVNWSEQGWPVFGMRGQVPKEFTIELPENTSQPIVISDDFNGNEDTLKLQWQWNHNPHNHLWSLTERKGCLRLKTGVLVNNVEHAPNTLTQRTEGPRCRVITRIDTSAMLAGDKAGLVALQHNFAAIGIELTEEGEKRVTLSGRGDTDIEENLASDPFQGQQIHLKADFDFVDKRDTVRFYYAKDGEDWIRLGESWQLKYTLDHFMGCRIGLFNYATVQTGGHADFFYFHYEKYQ
ncbi:glycoside hydrolase family 43 protein [Gracilibacillus alcaliphilus]|uniref:glycoside hydrolase family 43 protein n=1 Tax=Gracilibacillus alcaliphilus TaxID=1401441 RepID=UPI00195EFA09|nr:glycoside hydrolase 43 family protein [Gracilibacillus alcaliphilus]MBM7677698.1 beta-xylosidase [Gracilibacillus alcaliphilus]